MKTSMRRPVDRRENDIKKKLTAAVAMLLVSCIMVVTSTYAWFTLSTAPEVTGIQTTIAGNGNLEIALANGTTWNDETQVETLGGTADKLTTNASWGNLVSIDSENYGTNFLRLAPAKLSYVNNAPEGQTPSYDLSKLNPNLIEVPNYGADGRVTELSKAVIAATYKYTNDQKNKKEFMNVNGNDNGLRALGISSAMTERQKSFMTTMTTLNNSINSATSNASSALDLNGSELGNIAVKIATADNRNSLTFNNTEYDALAGLIRDTKVALEYLDTAIISAIKATIAGQDYQGTIDDITFNAIASALDGMSVLDTSDFVIDEKNNTITVNYGTDESQTISNASSVITLINKVRDVAKDLTDAQGAMPTKGGEDATYPYSSINSVLHYLMDTTGDIKIAGKGIDQLKGELIQDGKVNQTLAMELAKNCVIVLGEGSGVFYKIAELAGNIQAGIEVDVTYGVTLEDVPATIKSTYANPLLKVLSSTINGKAPSAAGSESANYISDFYAYALDLLFRTNAAESKLKLQTTPADRIYEGNNNAETMGAGSTMTFYEPANASFNEEKNG